MKVRVFASSSSGNCLLLSDGGTNILLDAGMSMRRVEKALDNINLSMREIGGVLITHEHSDHISGLKMLMKHYDFPVFAPSTVANHLRGMLPEIDGRLRVIPVGQFFELGSLRVMAFHTSHDTAESVGYRFEGRGSFALATDTGCITEEVYQGLLGAKAVLIESNHDENMLCDGPYPVYLKRRILSNRGHLSNESCARLARALVENGCDTVILGHLSCQNNDPRLAVNETEKALFGCNASIVCAPKLGMLEIDIGEGI